MSHPMQRPVPPWLLEPNEWLSAMEVSRRLRLDRTTITWRCRSGYFAAFGIPTYYDNSLPIGHGIWWIRIARIL